MQAYIRHVALAISLLAVTRVYAGELASLTASLPILKAPPLGEAHWIARSMRLNGLPMTIQSFATRLSVDDVFNYYEREWRGCDSAQITRTNKHDQRILGIKTAAFYISIEARATPSGSEGTIAVSPDFAKGVRKVATKFPHPGSASVVNLQEYEDLGINAEHISLVSTRAIEQEASEFSQLLVRTGWQLVQNRATHQTRQGHIIEAQRGAEQAQLTFQRQQSLKTSITVVWKKS